MILFNHNSTISRLSRRLQQFSGSTILNQSNLSSKRKKWKKTHPKIVVANCIGDMFDERAKLQFNQCTYFEIGK